MDLEPWVRVLVATGLALPVGLDRELRRAAHPRPDRGGSRSPRRRLPGGRRRGRAGVGGHPTRIASTVVNGIGFIGAGVIFAAQGRVHGLTTAASLFAAAAIGLSAGLELAIAAVLAIVAVAVLWPLDVLAERILASVAPRERVVQLVAAELGTLADVRRVLADLDVRARELDLRGTAHGVEARLVVRRDDATAARLRARLAEIEGLGFLSEEAGAGDD